VPVPTAIADDPDATAVEDATPAIGTTGATEKAAPIGTIPTPDGVLLAGELSMVTKGFFFSGVFELTSVSLTVVEPFADRLASAGITAIDSFVGATSRRDCLVAFCLSFCLLSNAAGLDGLPGSGSVPIEGLSNEWRPSSCAEANCENPPIVSADRIASAQAEHHRKR